MKKILIFLLSISGLFQSQAQTVRDVSTKDINDYNFWFRPVISSLKIGAIPSTPKVFLGNLHIDTLSKGIVNRIFSVSNLNNTSDLNKPISIATQVALNLKANTTLLNAKASTVSNDFTGINNFPLVGVTAQPNANIFTPSTGLILFANSNNALSWKGANGYFRTFDGTANTADRSYTLPNASGTIGLLESSQTWSGINRFSSNVTIGNSVNSSYKLDVAGTSRFTGSVFVDATMGGGLTISRGSSNTYFPYTDGFNYIRGKTILADEGGNVLIGTIIDAGNKLEVSGAINANEYKIKGYSTQKDMGIGDIYTRTRILQNTGLGVSDGLYIGFDNALASSNQIYDGGTANYLEVGSGKVSTNGLTKFLFGNQTDNGTFAQFSGDVSIKSNLSIINSNFSNTLTIKVLAAGAGNWAINPFITGVSNGGLSFNNMSTNTAPFVISASNNVGIGTDTPTQKLDVSGTARASQFQVSALNVAPASATSTGTLGEIRVTAGFIYLCTATNTWVRSALTTW